MSWEPIALAELQARIDRDLSDCPPELREQFERTRMVPAKWQLSPWGDLGGGFWAVAVHQSRVLWYNDIEDGFNVSRFDEVGTIPANEYWCNQDRLPWAVPRLFAASQKELMLSGALYSADDAELQAARLRGQTLIEQYNRVPPADRGARHAILTGLLGAIGHGTVIEPPFRCEYGFNISLGARTFINYEAVFLDCNRITIGSDVQIGPGTHIYTATHPLDRATRVSGLESARPVHIQDAVWLGGRTVVCPGVTIGAGTVVGAGSVVVKDLPSGVLAVGNPCRVVRPL